MPIKPIVIQKRMAELGRVRLGGEKQAHAPGRKLDAFRFTSASRELLESIAERYGGEVIHWEAADDEGMWQVYTEASELSITFPPTFTDADGEPTIPVTQWLELWSGGRAQRRCDGETEAFTGGPCLCDPDNRECKPTTRISFMLPDRAGFGVWRVESRGYNAAAETPGAVNILSRAAHEGVFIDAVLRLEHRTKRVVGEDHPRRFIVPVIDIPGASLKALVEGDVPLSINAPAPRPPRPELPQTAPEPQDRPFENDTTPEWGEAVPIVAAGEITYENEPHAVEPPKPTRTEEAERLHAEHRAHLEEEQELVRLTAELLAMLEQIGPTDTAEEAIRANASKNADDPAKHLTWLRGQKTRAEKALEAKP